jgi:NAD(P)-dependent dehydrogenase (short-subunit alcohol dehydrogenase family)
MNQLISNPSLAVPQLFSLAGKTAIVTGATGLIGQKHCEALAAAGANVVVADVLELQAKGLANQLGEKHIGLKLDVTNPNSLEKAKATILEKYGSIDVLVNNAAINDMFENPLMAKELSAFENYPLESFRKSLEVNVLGVFLCSQIFGSVMAEAGAGSIINIASTYGMVVLINKFTVTKTGSRVF